MQKKKNVLVDIDNTLAQTQHAYVQHANSLSQKKFVFERITKEFSDDPNDEFEALARGFIYSTDYSSTVETILPYKSAVDALKKIHDAGFGICIASSRIEHWHESTAHWLDTNGFLPFVDQIYLRTTDIDSTEFKILVAHITNAIAAFDDSYATAAALSSLDTFYLIDQPWNRSVPELKNVIRSKDFAEAVEAFITSQP